MIKVFFAGERVTDAARYFAIKTTTRLTIQFLCTRLIVQRRERGITIVYAAAIRADIAGSRVVEVQTPLPVYQN